MRFVDRDAFPEPQFLSSSAVLAYRKLVEDYLASGTEETRPPRVPDLILRHKELRNALEVLFEGRCSYCEISPGEVIDHFRPKAGSDREEGKFDFQYYCWLATEWENLYLCCHACNRSKGSKFPVKRPGAIGAAVSDLRHEEGAFLLDPCYDRPAIHFDMGHDGVFIGRSARGRSTIETLNLNRPYLAEERRRRFTELLRFRLMATPDQALQYVLPALHERRNGFLEIGLFGLLRPDHPLQSVRGEILDDAQREELARAVVLDGPSPTPDFDRIKPRIVEVERGERRYIRKVAIKNFRGIAEAVIEFPERGRDSGASVGSIVILGENAAGKTSLLQAVAVGALGPFRSESAGISPDWCLRDGAEDGSVVVNFFDTAASNTVTFRRGEHSFRGEQQVAVLVLGYGAYRLPAKRILREQHRRYGYRVQSLFDERKLVNGAIGLSQHLLSIDGGFDDSRILDATRTLNSLLMDQARATVTGSGQIAIKDGDRIQKLYELSSGYKSIVTVASDIMDVMYEVWQGMSSGQALILIDEIDAHLHPAWRLRVMDALRQAFPASQFLITTHDPLVLRGMDASEIRTMERGKDGSIEIATSAASVAALSIDQLLTSDLFGLDSTADPTYAALLDEYYGLLSLRRRTGEQEDALSTIEATLGRRSPVGQTRRERLLAGVIERYLDRAQTKADAWSPGTINDILAEFDEAERELDLDDIA